MDILCTIHVDPHEIIPSRACCAIYPAALSWPWALSITQDVLPAFSVQLSDLILQIQHISVCQSVEIITGQGTNKEEMIE